MTVKEAAVAKAQMLIRRPVDEVFNAFVDPTITTRFWFTHSSGPLVAGAKVVWRWEMYGAQAPVTVKTIEKNKRILIDWGEPPSQVEWLFTERADNTTLVVVSNWGFDGSDKEIVAKVIDSTGGFAFVLSGLKAYLEHDVCLNLVPDHHPDAQVS